MLKDLCTTFIFKGVVEELPKKGNMGELVQLGNETYVWLGSWEKIAPSEPVRELVRKNRVTNCPNCGGVLNPYRLKCEFCGTYVYKITYENDSEDEIEVTTLEDTRRVWIG